MAALETITVRALSPGAAGSAANPVLGDSLRIRNGKGVKMVGLWQTRAEAGKTMITSTRLHDAVTGIQVAGGGGTQNALPQTSQDLEEQDTLNVFVSGHSANGTSQNEFSSYNVFYKDLPGVDANLITHSEYMKRVNEIIGIEITVTPGAADYGAEVAINSTNNQFKSGEDYAIVGITAYDGPGSPGAHCVRVGAPELGHMKVGIPASHLARQGILSQDWFSRLSFINELPLIPVFNADNREQVMVDAVAFSDTTPIKLMVVAGRLEKRSRSRR